MIVRGRNHLGGNRRARSEFPRRLLRSPQWLTTILLVLGTLLRSKSVVSLSVVHTSVRCFASALSVSGNPRPREHVSRPCSHSHSLSHLTRSSVVAANTAGPLAATKGSPFDTAKGNGPSPSIEWIPTRIEFENVYRSYGKPDLWRILTSSVPRREFALRDLTLAFGKPQIENDGGTSSEDAVCLLLGASSSGKSTIFRSILEASAAAGNAESRSEMLFGSSENEGSVEILQREDSSTTATTMLSAVTPILLDDRGEVQAASGQSKTTIREAWNECIEEATGATTNDSGHPHTSLEKYLVETLAGAVLDLDPEALLADLTPSEGYRYCLGRACISSSARGGKLDDNGDDCWRLPGPILLLDEWMDVETSAVVRKVEPSLHKIVEELNGVVLSITHKPELYSASSPLRKITLSSGTLLADR